MHKHEKNQWILQSATMLENPGDEYLEMIQIWSHGYSNRSLRVVEKKYQGHQVSG